MQIYILTTTHFKYPYIKDTLMFYTCVYMYILCCIVYVHMYILHCMYVCIIVYSMFIFVCLILYVLYILYLWQVGMYLCIMRTQPLKLMDIICSRQQLTTLVLKSRSCEIIQNMMSLLEGPLLYL